jgi:hypothetical protein
MVLANIVSNSNVSVSKEFNVVDSIDKIIDGLPTLIVGYDLTDKLFPLFDITSTSLGNNMYWTFKRTERRDQYQEDLDKFIHVVYDKLIKEINYIFVDVIQYQPKTLIKIVRKILSMKKIITYIKDDMIYIYGEKMIFGVDLKLLTYVGMNSNKVKSKIAKVSDVFLENSKIFIEYKNIVETLGNKVRYIPYLYFIQNEQNTPSSIIHIPREG